MTNPKAAAVTRSASQADVRKVVDREVTYALKGRGPQTTAEWAFVRAIYNHDKRLG